MRQAKIKRVRRAIRFQRREQRDYEEQSARVGVDTGWRWAILKPCLPVLLFVLPYSWVLWMANRAAGRFRWRIDRGDWRPFDPPRHFTADDL